MTQLTPAAQKFIVHWGEMGTKWGINRTLAQVFALLYISQEALNADQIRLLLNVARSNVSTCLKELQIWGLIKVVHNFGDPKDYFESLKDPSEIIQLVMTERKKREVDPAIDILQKCLAETGTGHKADHYNHKQLKVFLDTLMALNGFFEQVKDSPLNKWFKAKHK
jgi:DNA-binding transcriptional regulator GbsR (MarR family)